MPKHAAPPPPCPQCRGAKTITIGSNGSSQTVTCPTCWGKGTA